jgi:hypothetical protein
MDYSEYLTNENNAPIENFQLDNDNNNDYENENENEENNYQYENFAKKKKSSPKITVKVNLTPKKGSTPTKTNSICSSEGF